jgi:hypothetical protein
MSEMPKARPQTADRSLSRGLDAGHVRRGMQFLINIGVPLLVGVVRGEARRCRRADRHIAIDGAHCRLRPGGGAAHSASSRQPLLAAHGADRAADSVGLRLGPVRVAKYFHASFRSCHRHAARLCHCARRDGGRLLADRGCRVPIRRSRANVPAARRERSAGRPSARCESFGGRHCPRRVRRLEHDPEKLALGP